MHDLILIVVAQLGMYIYIVSIITILYYKKTSNIILQIIKKNKTYLDHVHNVIMVQLTNLQFH